MSSRVLTVRRSWFVPTAVFVLVATLLAPASAQPSSDDVRRDIGSAEERLHHLENQLGEVVDAYNEVAAELEAIEAELATTETELAELVAQRDELHLAVEDHVRRLHKLGPGLEVSNLIVAGTVNDASDRMAVLRRIIDAQWADLEAYEASQTSVAAAEDRLAMQRSWVADRAELLDDRRAEVETFIGDQQGEIEALEAELQAAISREEAAARRAEERRRRAAALQAQQERAAAGEDGAATTAAAPAAHGGAQVALDAALSKLGSRYQWGATGPNSFDCSGLMVWAWRQAGVSLPRSSASQFASLPRISRSELQPGDLVFSGSPNVHHVGMYIGNGQIVHSPHTGAVVRIQSMERSDLRGFARVR